MYMQTVDQQLVNHLKVTDSESEGKCEYNN